MTVIKHTFFSKQRAEIKQTMHLHFNTDRKLERSTSFDNPELQVCQWNIAIWPQTKSRCLMHTSHVLHQTYYTVTKLFRSCQQTDDAINKNDTQKKEVNNYQVGCLLCGRHRALRSCLPFPFSICKTPHSHHSSHRCHVQRYTIL